MERQAAEKKRGFWGYSYKQECGLLETAHLKLSLAEDVLNCAVAKSDASTDGADAAAVAGAVTAGLDLIAEATGIIEDLRLRRDCRTPGVRIASERVRLELSQEQLAGKLGVPTGRVRSWESGEEEPMGRNLIMLAVLYGCTPEYLLGLSDDRTLAPVQNAGNA